MPEKFQTGEKLYAKFAPLNLFCFALNVRTYFHNQLLPMNNFLPQLEKFICLEFRLFYMKDVGILWGLLMLTGFRKTGHLTEKELTGLKLFRGCSGHCQSNMIKPHTYTVLKQTS